MKLISKDKPTIIIAAHNEAAVIKNTLSVLLKKEKPALYQVIVVCNGCNDGTDEVIQRHFPSVRCLVLECASKALAIRYAESFDPGFPRLYLDADIELSSAGAEKLFKQGGDITSPALIIPTSEVVTQSCSSLVKRFYRVWYHSRFIQQMGYGAGAYLLNSSARQRFGLWPELIADDGFIRSQFTLNEIHINPLCKVLVRAPKNLFTLIKVKTRSKLGNLELEDYLKSVGHTKVKNTGNKNKNLDSPVNRVVYLSINLAALALAKWHYKRGNKTWYRDNSNR